MVKHAACDIFGDVHGHHDALTALLRHLGYRETGGAWRHPHRTAVFVGDFVDRGPKQVETVSLVRAMVDAGSALAVMGNHELNAVAWHMPDPCRPGEYLRRHDERNRAQHAAFLAAVEGKPALHAEMVRWFLTLPLWLDLPGLRVAHACGHPRFVDYLAPRLRDARLTEDLVAEAVTRPADRSEMDTPELPLFKAVDAVAKGLEVPLPAGFWYADKEGVRRDRARVRWWDAEATTYRAAALFERDSTGDAAKLPELPLPAHVLVGTPDEGVHFFGHYWFTGAPMPAAPRAACVDYSVGKGGKLVAYRWDGEPELRAENFAWAGAR